MIGDNLLARAGALLAPKLPQKRAVVVTDQAVAGLHLQTLLGGLAETAIEATAIVVKGGEACKNMDTYAEVVDQLLEARVERRTAVIALGGGVVGDLAGFAAATTLRGLPFIQIPTTLLSQVDSSVGGKTGVNTQARQEPCRCVLPAAHGPGRHGHAGDPAASRTQSGLCRGRQSGPDRRRCILFVVRVPRPRRGVR